MAAGSALAEAGALEQVFEFVRLRPPIRLGRIDPGASLAAACQGQRGSYNMARASETASASPFAA